MDELVGVFLVPTVLMALAALIIDGVEAAFSLREQIKSRRINEEQRRISYAVALLSLIDGLPIDSGEKLVMKTQVLNQELRGRLSVDIERIITSGYDSLSSQA